jgi:hypothetical protein
MLGYENAVRALKGISGTADGNGIAEYADEFRRMAFWNPAFGSKTTNECSLMCGHRTIRVVVPGEELAHQAQLADVDYAFAARLPRLAEQRPVQLVSRNR